MGSSWPRDWTRVSWVSCSSRWVLGIHAYKWSCSPWVLDLRGNLGRQLLPPDPLRSFPLLLGHLSCYGYNLASRDCPWHGPWPRGAALAACLLPWLPVHPAPEAHYLQAFSSSLTCRPSFQSFWRPNEYKPIFHIKILLKSKSILQPQWTFNTDFATENSIIKLMLHLITDDIWDYKLCEGKVGLFYSPLCIQCPKYHLKHI